MRPARAARPARPCRGRDDAGALRFRHGLVREAAYASLAKSARARLHERRAGWLDGLGGELPEADARIAFHLETACRYEQEIGARRRRPSSLARAGRRLEAAARVARGRGDLLGEIGFLDRAVALLGTDREQGVALLPTLVSALADAGASHRAEELADRAVSTSAALGLPRAGARSAIERERIRLCRHPESFDVAAAVAVVEHASETLRDGGDELGLARAAYLMSDLTWLHGRPGRVLRRRRAHARSRAPRRERVRRRDGAHLPGLGAGRGAVAGRRGDRALRRAWRRRPPASAPPS